MKKISTKVSMFLMALTMGVATTSCGVEDVLNSDVVNVIISALLNTGQTYTFNGSSAAWAYTYVGTVNQKKTAEAAFENQQAAITVSTSGTTKLAQLTCPTYSLDSIQVSNLVLYNLVFTDGDDASTLSIGDNTTITGNFVYKNKTYTAFYAKINSSSVTQQNMTVEAVAQFAAQDENGNTLEDEYMQFNFKFVGTAPSN